jgi:hypothetical protein
MTYPRVAPAMRARIPLPAFTQMSCAYCRSNNHELCPWAFRNGNGSVLQCKCQHESHDDRTVRKCIECLKPDDVEWTDRKMPLDELMQITEVDPWLWLCWDRDACDHRVEQRLLLNPSVQNIRRVQAKVKQDKINRGEAVSGPKRDRSPGRPKTGSCLCCGETTGGGKFLPGHDARLVKKVSERIAAAPDTKDQELADFKVG